MSSGNQPPQNIVTTQNKDPWSGAQPALSGIINAAGGLYASGVGYQPYMGATQASLDPSLASALGQTDVMAHQDMQQGGGFGTGAAGNLALNVINSQGMTPGINNAVTGLGGAASQYGNIYNNQEPANMYRTVFNTNYGQENPYLQGTIAAHDRQIADKVNSAMSGAGRYGSGAHTDVLARSLAEAANPILAQDYQSRQQNQLAASQGMLGVGQQQLGATQGLGQTMGAISDIYGQGLNRAGQYSQFLPTIDQMRYAPNDRSAQVGQYYQDRAQQALAGQIGQYNAQQAYPWEQLSRYNAIVGGAGGLGGTTVQSQPNLNLPVSGLQKGLGGALAGAGLGGSIFGPAGAALGGLGGAALGFL